MEAGMGGLAASLELAAAGARVDSIRERIFSMLARHGLVVGPVDGVMVTTAPADFGELFPATGGGFAPGGFRPPPALKDDRIL